ncbi:MAG: MraY family glycosyltransferase [Bryobacteraceae bacterium]|jgi:UDP-GlcNAc:undecaprenyl-phosphate GlcNAc-1-phosphate transferase
MLSLVTLAASALLLTLAVTPACRALCRRFGWVDQPDRRKVHRRPIPRAGGIAILFGFAAALALVRFSPLWASYSVTWSPLSVCALLPAVFVAFATGLLDDILGLKPWMKILGQILAAALACNAHVQIHGIGGYTAAGTWWQVPLTILWLVGCANAFNLIDGLDGLATGVGLFATATAFLSARLTGNSALALVTAPLLGALLGFLPYNFSSASIFMGDCGSLTVGFLLGCFGVIWSQKSATLLGMTAPLIAMAIPLLDTALAISRRFLRGQAIFAADRGHIHHRLLARGFTPRRIAYLLYATAGLLAGLSLLMSYTHLAAGVVVAFCAIIWLAIRYLGYEEFNIARRMVFGGFFRRTLNANLSVTQFEQAIQAARTVDDCWVALLDTSRTLGLSAATLRLHGCEFTATLAETAPAECWLLNIPLDGAGHLDMAVPFRPSQPPPTIGPLAASLRTVLAPKLLQLQSQPPLEAPAAAFSD